MLAIFLATNGAAHAQLACTEILKKKTDLEYLQEGRFITIQPMTLVRDRSLDLDGVYLAPLSAARMGRITYIRTFFDSVTMEKLHMDMRYPIHPDLQNYVYSGRVEIYDGAPVFMIYYMRRRPLDREYKTTEPTLPLRRAN